MADDVLDDLEREAREYDKDAEIDRIMSAFRLNAYAVLGLQPGVPESDIKKIYRSKSLLIHPDKTTNPLAPEAFDRLKKAQTALIDEKQRTRLDEAIADARMLVLRKRGWTVDHPDIQTDEFKRAWTDMSREVIIEAEIRKKRQAEAQMREEGRQQKKEEDEMMERRQKREFEQAWESTRDDRVASWRDFQKKSKSGAKDRDGEERRDRKRKSTAETNGEVNGIVNGAGDFKTGEPKVKKVKKEKKMKVLG